MPACVAPGAILWRSEGLSARSETTESAKEQRHLADDIRNGRREDGEQPHSNDESEEP